VKKSILPFALSAMLMLTGLAALTASTGCATMGEAPTLLIVEAFGPNQFRVYDEECDLAHLAKAVERTGAERATEIRLQSNPSMPPSNLANAFAVLQSAGYLKVIVSHPREATIEIKQPGQQQPAQTAPAKRPPPNTYKRK
jgi:hypothetical protein